MMGIVTKQGLLHDFPHFLFLWFDGEQQAKLSPDQENAESKLLVTLLQ